MHLATEVQVRIRRKEKGIVKEKYDISRSYKLLVGRALEGL